MLAQREIDFLHRLRHPNIVRILGSHHESDTFSVIMELVPGHSLADLLIDLGPFSEKVIKNLTRQISLALEYCHHHKCTHRDIKGKNILLATDGTIKLCE